MCFGKDCEEAIITGIAKDSIHLYKDIVGIQTDSIIKTNSEKILDPFIHLTYIDDTDGSYPFNGFEGTIFFPVMLVLNINFAEIVFGLI